MQARRYRTIVSLGLIAIITFLAFSPCLRNGFVNWDDDKYVTENPAIRLLSWDNIKQIFGSFFVSNYHPLTILSYALEYRFFKLDPFFFHLTNILLHIINSLLVFWLVYLLSKKNSVAVIAALLFGIHPLHVESVAWISERKDLLYGCFFLGAAICYCRYLRENYRPKFYWGSLILFLLSLLSKAMALSLPLVLFLIDYLTERKFDKSAVIDKIRFFVLSLVFGVIAVHAQYSSGAVRQEGIVNIFNKISVAGYSIAFYLHKLFLPTGLSSIYPYPHMKGGSGYHAYLYSFIAIAACALIVIFSKRYTRKVIFGTGFFLIAICPVLQFVPIGQTVVADRYVYIPSLGVFYIVAVGIVWAFSTKIGYARLLRALTALVLPAILSAMFLLTWDRAKVWKDGLSLWNDVIARYPDQPIPTAYFNRGLYYLQKEKLKAVSDIDKALMLQYQRRGIQADNRQALNKMLEAPQGYADALNFLGVGFAEIGRTGEASILFVKAIEINPQSPQTYTNLVSLLGNSGQYKQAIETGKKALAINPDSPELHYNLAIAYYFEHQYALMNEHMDKAIKLGHKVPPQALELIKPYRNNSP